MFDRIIKQVWVEPSDDVYHVPAGEEPHARRRPRGDAPGADGGQRPDGVPGEGDGDGEGAAEKAAAALAAKQQEVEELSKRILKTAGDEAAKITQAAQEKAEALREAARRDGYRDAREEKAREISGSLARVEQVLAELNDRQDQFFAAYEQELESLAIAVAEKILAHAVERDPAQMADLVMQAVGSVKTDDWITVELSDQLPELAGYLQKEYAEYLDRRQIELAMEDAPKGTCIVQTPTGITDASIATQLGNLRDLIKTETREEA